MKQKPITVLGIGCTLYADQGFGVSVVQLLEQRHVFPESVRLVDGGLVGVSLFGLMAQSSIVIAVDAIRNGGRPGELYRLEQPEIMERLRLKNNIQQVDFLEALAHCQALDDPPEAVMIGVEPQDTETLSCALTPLLREQSEAAAAQVLNELQRLGISWADKRV